MKRAVIIAGGEINDAGIKFYKDVIERADYIAAVDSGADFAGRNGIMPDIIVGDMDSISKEMLEYYKKFEVEMAIYPVEKDLCDGEIAIQIVKSRGYDIIDIIGGLGGRSDHMLGNIFMLDKYENIRIISEKESLESVTGYRSYEGIKGKTVSILSLSYESKIKYIKGMKYCVDNISLKRGDTTGISNIAESEKAEIEVESGKIIVIVNN